MRVTFHDSERARNHAISATIADIRLDEYSAEFCANNGARGASFQASRFFAMLANIRRKRPRIQLWSVAAKSRLRDLFHKLYVPPRLCAHRAGVVVRITTPVETALAYRIPFLARNFASFAADAQCRICQECRYRHFELVILNN
jgi:hypothetical protein